MRPPQFDLHRGDTAESRVIEGEFKAAAKKQPTDAVLFAKALVQADFLGPRVGEGTAKGREQDSQDQKRAHKPV